MIDHPNLIPECNVDTAFVEMLGYKNPNHAPSITKVSSILEINKASQRAMGFIDNDKKLPLYFLHFTELDRADNVRLLKHKEREHYLVVVNPAMDTFIFNLCQTLDINPVKYKFPSELKPFTSFTKKESIKTSPDFKNLLNAIKQRKPEVILKIQLWVTQYSPYK